MKSIYRQQRGQRRRFRGVIKKLNQMTTDVIQGHGQFYFEFGSSHVLDSLRQDLDENYRRPTKDGPAFDPNCRWRLPRLWRTR
jgi:hypothetical protein